MAVANISVVRRSSGDRGRRSEGEEKDAVDIDDLLGVDASPVFLQFLDDDFFSSYWRFAPLIAVGRRRREEEEEEADLTLPP